MRKWVTVYRTSPVATYGFRRFTGRLDDFDKICSTSKTHQLRRYCTHFTRKGINCNEKPHEHVRYQKNAENLLISTYIVAEFGRSSFLRNLHLKLSTFSSSFFIDFPEISRKNVTADPRGLFLSNCLPSYLKRMTKLIFFSLFYNILPKKLLLDWWKGSWNLVASRKMQNQRIF